VKSMEALVQEAWEFANSPKTNWFNLLSQYERWYAWGLCTKHHTHDSVFFIVDEGDGKYKAYKFYNGGEDYRVGGEQQGLAEAYNEAVLNL
jgi:hypothetical protein